jgi:hypothetical protein
MSVKGSAGFAAGPDLSSALQPSSASLLSDAALGLDFGDSLLQCAQAWE